MKILLATRNKDKVKEITAILQEFTHVDFVSTLDFPDLPEVEETGETLEANAILKARTLAGLTGLHTLSDDTGLFVDALDGAPGVYSSRFAGEGCSYRDNRLKLLSELGSKPDRSARFRTVVAFASPEVLIGTEQGEVEGIITHTERGGEGFGYDAIFEVAGTGLTFGEMNDGLKNLLSHRARAFRNIVPLLLGYLRFKKETI